MLEAPVLFFWRNCDCGCCQRQQKCPGSRRGKSNKKKTKKRPIYLPYLPGPPSAAAGNLKLKTDTKTLTLLSHIHPSIHTHKYCTHIHVYKVDTSIHSFIHILIHACKHANMHTSMHTSMQTCIQACKHACKHANLDTYTHTHTFRHTWTHCRMKWLCCGTVALANTVCLSFTLFFVGTAAPVTLPAPTATNLAASSSSCVIHRRNTHTQYIHTYIHTIDSSIMYV